MKEQQEATPKKNEAKATTRNTVISNMDHKINSNSSKGKCEPEDNSPFSLNMSEDNLNHTSSASIAGK